MSTQSARSPRFNVGDIARSINSKWPVLNHRLVEITEIAAEPRYPGQPYRIRRVDGSNWFFPQTCGDGHLRMLDLPLVWCAEADLLSLQAWEQAHGDIAAVGVHNLVGEPS